MEQIEFANVILLNKVDLVTQKQVDIIRDRVGILNPRAKLIESMNSEIDIKEVVNKNAGISIFVWINKLSQKTK